MVPLSAPEPLDFISDDNERDSGGRFSYFMHRCGISTSIDAAVINKSLHVLRFRLVKVFKAV